MHSRASQATYHDNMTSITHKFIVDAMPRLCCQPHWECNPFKEQLEKSEDKTKVYIVMHIPTYNVDTWTPYLLAPVPIANFPTGVHEIVDDPKFSMKTVCVSDLGLGYPGSKFKDINDFEVPDYDTKDLTSVLEITTKKMWSVVKEDYKLGEMQARQSLVEILKTVDVEGLIIYCDPALHTCQECMLPIYKSMIKTMWGEICKDGSEYERKQKKHKSV